MARKKKIDEFLFEKVYEVLSIKQVVTVREDITNPFLCTPSAVAKLVQNEIADDDREIFLVIALNSKNKVIAIHRCHIGSINRSIVHPREVYKAAILNNAASIVIGHQHPSGNTDPSTEDIEVTKRLKEAGKIIGIEVLDHLIVSPTEYTSLREAGYM